MWGLTCFLADPKTWWVADHLSQFLWCKRYHLSRGSGRKFRGMRENYWRYHAVRYRIVAETRRTRRARRGRPTKTDPPPTESGYRMVVEAEVLSHPEENTGWTVLATTVGPEEGTDTEILQA